MHLRNHLKRATLACLILATGSSFAQTTTPSAAELGISGYKSYSAKDYKRSAELYQAAVDVGDRDPEDAYNAACSYALSGDKEHAFTMLDKAIGFGMHDAANMAKDPDLSSLRDDPRWARSLALAKDNERQYQQTHRNPDSAKFITSDVTLFWSVYDQLQNSQDPIGAIRQQYLNAGTVGLQQFVPTRIRSADNLYATMQKYPKYFAGIRQNTLKVASVEPEVRTSLRKFKDLYDDALFPDVYFVIGAASSGGTTGSSGLLLGAEMHGLGPGVPTDELSPWLKAVVKPYTVLPNIIAHELMHFQQKHEAKSLLAKCIHEGSADFVASFISSSNFNQAVYDYGYAHEAELWQRFQKQMHGDDASEWLYGASQRDGHPADLGYFMGFRISQAYYECAKDKKRAIADILNVKDFDELLAKSGYGEQFTKTAAAK